MKLKRYGLETLLGWLSLLAFMCTFQPSQLPVILFIIPFILLYMATKGTWGLVQALSERYLAKDASSKTGVVRLGTIVCGCLVLCVVLQSLGQLTLRDVATVLAIAILGYLYIMRNRTRSIER